MQKQGEKQGTFSDSFVNQRSELMNADKLSFLKQTDFEPVISQDEWSLYDSGKKLEPLKFSNGKNQSDVVKEIVNHIKSGTKLVFLHGACGTGKSAIALHLARELGSASIVVPVKNLQRQYEEDYTSKKYVLQKNGKKLKIASITGRENHDSILFPGISCADINLPELISFTETNYNKLEEYYLENPYVNVKDFPGLKNLKRLAIAPANPYWSPILPAGIEVPFKDAKKYKYEGMLDKEYVFYHRKSGCSYYDQYLAYVQADVLIFNAAKYKIEMALNRKPRTKVDIIDEADEFLDSFSVQEEINLTKLAQALKVISFANPKAHNAKEMIIELVNLEEKQKQALGIDNKKLVKINETFMFKIIQHFLKNSELENELVLEEQNYANHGLEIAEMFQDLLDDTYVTYRRHEGELYCSLVTTNLSKKFKELLDKVDSLVLMSGTLHSPEVIKSIFGIDKFVYVEAESKPQGLLELQRTGKEFDCKYSSFSSGLHSRADYLKALDIALGQAKRPTLVQVNAYDDLPSDDELYKLELQNCISKETLQALQYSDKTGRLVSMFKSGMADILFTTKCSRGVDFPGKQCNSIVFTKYPNPNTQDIFWKLLQQTHPQAYWDFYKDKARREFLQRMYRGLRSKDDEVTILSPDKRVLDMIRQIQETSHKA